MEGGAGASACHASLRVEHTRSPCLSEAPFRPVCQAPLSQFMVFLGKGHLKARAESASLSLSLCFQALILLLGSDTGGVAKYIHTHNLVRTRAPAET